MKKYICLLLLPILLGCTKNEKKEVRLTDEFDTVENVQPKFAFSPNITDEITAMTFINGKLVFCKVKSDPLFEFFDTDTYKNDGSFGRKGHGRGEFVMPHLFSGNDDTLCIIDNGKDELSYIYNGKISKKREISLKVPANSVQTLSFPYVGFYGLVGNTIEWNIYDVAKNEIVDTVFFSDQKAKDKVFFNSFSWDSYNDHVVFASMFFDRFRIITLSSDKTVEKDITYIWSDNTPKESRCYYSDVCCNKYIYILSQKNIEDFGKHGTSEIEIYDYSGEPVKKMKLDDFYLYMTIDKSKGNLYLYNYNKENVMVINDVK